MVWPRRPSHEELSLYQGAVRDEIYADKQCQLAWDSGSDHLVSMAKADAMNVICEARDAGVPGVSCHELFLNLVSSSADREWVRTPCDNGDQEVS